jgi:hypothetical protein
MHIFPDIYPVAASHGSEWLAICSNGDCLKVTVRLTIKCIDLSILTTDVDISLPNGPPTMYLRVRPFDAYIMQVGAFYY